jgi:hypothetical protein
MEVEEMDKAKRRDDIHNRFTLALAERDAFTQKDSDNYKTLSAIIKNILSEYQNGKHLRHGFRLYGARYSEIILQDCETI